MGREYYLYSIKLGAWMGRSVFTSDVEQARRFAQEDAYSRAREGRLTDGDKSSLTIIPIPCDDIERVLA